MSKRILYINSVYSIGSTGKLVEELHDNSKKFGYESRVFYGRKKIKKKEDVIYISNKLSVFFNLIITRVFDLHLNGSIFSTRRMIRKIKKFDPDIIHLHNIHGYYINVKHLLKFLKTYTKPIVITLHDCWLFTGHCSHFDYIGCEKWKSQCYKCPQKKEYPTSFLFDNSFKNFKIKRELLNELSDLSFISPSLWLQTKVEESFISNYYTKVINNGIDLSIYDNKQTEELKENKKIFNILCIASKWTKKKGIEDIINLSKISTEEFLITIVGNTSTYDFESFGNIHLLGVINNREELVKIYKNADVFFNPSLEENYPTVNLEAMAAGLPILAYNVGGNPEVINDETGRLFSKHDIEGVHSELIKIMTNNHIYDSGQIIKASRNIAGMKKYLERHFKFYNEIVGGHSD